MELQEKNRSHLIVVPRHKLDEVVVEGDTSLGVEDAGVEVAVHVGGDNLVLGVAENACMLWQP